MSLVNEALKKVRVESAARQTASAYDASLVPPPYYGGESRGRSPLWWAAGTAVVLSFVLALTIVLSMSPGEVAQVTSSGAAPQVEPPISTVQTPAVASPVVETTTTPATVAPVPRVETTQVAEVPVAPAEPETVVPAQPAVPALPTLVEGKVYIQSVEAATGIKVRLDGVIWSESTPTALVNGVNLGVGEEIDGITLVQIEQRRVKLQAQGKSFFLRLP